MGNSSSSNMIAGCTAYDLILVHTTTTNSSSSSSSITDTTTTNHTKEVPPPPSTTTTTPHEATQQPLSSIGASECIFRFGTQYSSSSSSTYSTSSDHQVSHRQQQNSRTAVYLVVHHSQTGDIIRFPISVYNTIQQPPPQEEEEDSVVVTLPTSNASHYNGEPLQQRQHDPLALQLLMDALTTNKAGTIRRNHCGPYKANFILVSCNDNKNDHDRPTSTTTTSETVLGIAPFRIFIYPCHTTKLAIVDVDGTITTSTLSGFWNTAVLQDYSTRHCHNGVCSFFTQFVNTVVPSVSPSTTTSSSTTTTTTTTTPTTTTTTGITNTTTSTNPLTIQPVYLTNRPITYVDATRSLLNELQDDTYTLPKGPLIGFTGNLAGVFKMDFYHVNAHEFKYNTLEKYVLQPFLDVGVTTEQIFYAGFGNTLYDMYAYQRAGIDAHRMFIIDKQSRIYACDAPIQSTSPESTDGNNNSKQKAMQLDHPKQYESMKGTMFAAGYLDPNLITYISNLKI